MSYYENNVINMEILLFYAQIALNHDNYNVYWYISDILCTNGFSFVKINRYDNYYL